MKRPTESPTATLFSLIGWGAVYATLTLHFLNFIWPSCVLMFALIPPSFVLPVFVLVEMRRGLKARRELSSV